MAGQLTNFKIDQTATFEATVFVQSAPKLEYGSDKQARAQNGKGAPKWDVQVMCAVRNPFGAPDNQVLKVGIVSETDPGAGFAQFTPVVLVGFEVGVMESKKKNPQTGEEKVVGASVWFRADEIRSTAATGTSGGGRKGQQAGESAAA